MITMVNIFSAFVFGEIFPNPTLVRLLSVKYSAVMYLVFKSGPLCGSLALYRISVSLANMLNQPFIFKFGISKSPNAYQMHASQWATRANPNINSNNNAIPYSEYRSTFLATRTRRSNLAVFSKPISLVVCLKNEHFQLTAIS